MQLWWSLVKLITKTRLRIMCSTTIHRCADMVNNFTTIATLKQLKGRGRKLTVRWGVKHGEHAVEGGRSSTYGGGDGGPWGSDTTWRRRMLQWWGRDEHAGTKSGGDGSGLMACLRGEMEQMTWSYQQMQGGGGRNTSRAERLRRWQQGQSGSSGDGDGGIVDRTKRRQGEERESM
jgi:hypothetical protein